MLTSMTDIMPCELCNQTEQGVSWSVQALALAPSVWLSSIWISTDSSGLGQAIQFGQRRSFIDRRVPGHCSAVECCHFPCWLITRANAPLDLSRVRLQAPLKPLPKGYIRGIQAVPVEAAPMSDIVLETNQLQKHFGSVRAVESVSLSARRGHVLGFLGKNGAGRRPPSA